MLIDIEFDVKEKLENDLVREILILIVFSVFVILYFKMVYLEKLYLNNLLVIIFFKDD